MVLLRRAVREDPFRGYSNVDLANSVSQEVDTPPFLITVLLWLSQKTSING